MFILHCYNKWLVPFVGFLCCFRIAWCLLRQDVDSLSCCFLTYQSAVTLIERRQPLLLWFGYFLRLKLFLFNFFLYGLSFFLLDWLLLLLFLFLLQLGHLNILLEVIHKIKLRLRMWINFNFRNLILMLPSLTNSTYLSHQLLFFIFFFFCLFYMILFLLFHYFFFFFHP